MNLEPSPVAITALLNRHREACILRIRTPIAEHNGWLLYSFQEGDHVGYSAFPIRRGEEPYSTVVFLNLSGILVPEGRRGGNIPEDTFEIFKNIVSLAL